MKYFIFQMVSFLAYLFFMNSSTSLANQVLNMPKQVTQDVDLPHDIRGLLAYPFAYSYLLMAMALIFLIVLIHYQNLLLH